MPPDGPKGPRGRTEGRPIYLTPIVRGIFDGMALIAFVYVMAELVT